MYLEWHTTIEGDLEDSFPSSNRYESVAVLNVNTTEDLNRPPNIFAVIT